MRKRRTITPGMRVAAGALLLSVATLAAGQQDSIAVGSLGKIEVTGSNIRRTEGESGLPLQIITGQELINGGVQTAQELLERISANQSFGGFNEAKGIGNTVVGFTAASLRGLGSSRTLVLLNGLRLAPYAMSGGQGVDLSGIPASALERVEILKDGASAVYGTDAIGGVINFILRKDFTGVELNANYFATTQGGGNNGRINATAGYGDLAKDRYNIFLTADYFRQDSLKASQRAGTDTGYIPWLAFDRTSGTSFPANITQPGGFSGTRNPTIPATGATADSCLPPYSFPTQTHPQTCQFDVVNVIDTIPQSEKTNVFGRFTWQIDPDLQFFAAGSWYGGTFIQRIAPTPVAGIPASLPPTSPYYPAAFISTLPGGDTTLPVQLRYRTFELGPRVDQANVNQWNGVAGVQGNFKGWDYDIAANYTANQQTDNFVSGWVNGNTFGPLLNSGVINPFGYNTDAVLTQMQATQVIGQANINRASNYGGNAKVSNTVYDLPGGPVAVALGFEGHRETLEQINADFITNLEVLGGPGPVPTLPVAHRTVLSLFGEINVPIVKTLEVNVAARYDHYSDFGGTTNPKITLRWQPRPELLLRAAYGTGFRAPTLSDLFQPVGGPGGITGDTNLSDPLRCPVTQSPDDCNTGFGLAGGGNPLLQPETSHQINAGIVFEPVSGLSMSVDYYQVNISNAILELSSDTLFADYALWAPAHVVRNPPDAQYPNLPGSISYVILTQVNAGTLTTSGIDIDLRWRAPATSIGRFTLALTGTYVINYQVTGFSTAGLPSFPGGPGARGDDGAISRWRHYATVNWNYGAWGATLANTFQLGYSENDLTTCDADNVCGTRRVGSYSIWDLQGRYTGFTNCTLILGLRNAFDTPPPVSNQAGAQQAGLDPSYADPRGRMVYAAIRYAFK